MSGKDPDSRPPVPPRDATARLDVGAMVPTSTAILVVVEGEQPGLHVGLDRGRVVIGSDRQAGLPLLDRGVSKNHAEVQKDSQGHRLRDLDSTNGTFLNGNRIREAYLNPGDLVKIGTCKLRFESRLEDTRVPPSLRSRFGPLYGQSLQMRQIFGVLERISPTDFTVLIKSESGTGKDLLARAIHENSPRAAQPFVVFDCSVTSPELISSELFGHVEGAFTGASRTRKGAFLEAQGGTIFLDEIGELPAESQPKLLRVLENRSIQQVGGDRALPIDVRVIAATHRDLEQMVAEGKFRQDLFFRLAVISVRLPPLRERREDVPGLVTELLKSINGPHGKPEVTAEALDILAGQTWPGNVRELRNVLERSVALSAARELDPRDLMLSHRMPGSGGTPAPGGGGPESWPFSGKTLSEIEQEVIRRTLEQTGGNQKEAARLLGIHRDTLRKKTQ